MDESTLLIVDDEQAIVWGLSQIANEMGFRVITASSAEEALSVVRQSQIDLIAMDVRLPGMTGLQAMVELRRTVAEVPIVIMTAYGDLQTAVEAVRQGAMEYLVKPFDSARFRLALDRALAARRTTAGAPLADDSIEGFVAKSSEMQQVFNEVALAAASDANVLVEGESGTGKELVARAIHRFSARAGKPLVAVHIAALSPQLIESELFGHVRGAYTGADSEKRGLLQLADGGTLFLDEVAEIPPSVQVKLLRALELREITQVGATASQRSNFRVVAATHRDLYGAAQQGAFRLDLFFRLAVYRIKLPPLRQREADIVPLANHFLAQFNRSNQTQCALAPSAVEELQQRAWRGNIRELKHAVEHAAIAARGGLLDAAHFPAPLVELEAPGSQRGIGSDLDISRQLKQWTESRLADPNNHGKIDEQLMELVQPPVYQTVLEHSGGQLANAARWLGIHRTTLKRKIEGDRAEEPGRPGDKPQAD